MDSVCTMMEFLERLQNLRSGHDLTRSRAQNVMPLVENFERLARAKRLYELDRMQEERNEHWLRVAFDKWSMSTLENWERFARAATLVDLQEEWHEQDLQEEWNENSLRVAFSIWKDEICPPLTVDQPAN
jgi:hypothetical protein